MSINTAEYHVSTITNKNILRKSVYKQLTNIIYLTHIWQPQWERHSNNYF